MEVIEAALEQAQAAAGGRDVTIGGGAHAINQYLAAALVDELELHVVPLGRAGELDKGSRYDVSEGAIIGRSCDIRDHVRIQEGASIGDEVTIGSESSIAPHVRIYPYKEVETGSQVYENVIWETRASSRLFGKDGGPLLAKRARAEAVPQRLHRRA